MVQTLAQQAAQYGLVIPDPDRHYPPEPAPPPTTVRDLIDRLEFDKFATMGDRPAWEDLNEVQQLAREQLADDTHLEGIGSRRSRIGRTWVESAGPMGEVGHATEDGKGLWRRYTPEQAALERAFTVFLDQVTEKQREVLRLVYYAGDSFAVAAEKLGITKSLVQKHVTLGLASLDRLLRRAFTVTDEELLELTATAPVEVHPPKKEPDVITTTLCGPVRISSSRSGPRPAPVLAVFEPYGPTELKEVLAAGARRAKDGQVNRRFTEEQYALLVRNRSQARGDLASAEGHHFALTRVHDRALTEQEDSR